jgi:hypothetical protein
MVASAAYSGRAEVTPVQKVVELLNEMLSKGKTAKQEEQVQFAAFKQFCDDTTVEKKKAVEAAAETIDMLKANIQKYTADAAQLTKEIAGHDADIAAWGGDEKAATKVREIEHADYEAMHEDYSESEDALRRAIEVLKKQAYSRAQASLTQVVNLNLIPAEARKAIDLFLQQGFDEEPLAVSAPEAAGYEFQSHGIVELLEKLLDKFIDEKTTLEKEEMNGKHAYEILMQDLKAQIDQATTERGEKAEIKAKKLQAKADDEGSLQDTTSTMEADQKYLDDLTATCESKASDYEQRQHMRGDEIEAIGKAIEILSSEKVSGSAEKYLPSALVQAKGNGRTQAKGARPSTALAQLRSASHSPTQERAAQFLASKAGQINSRILSTLAMRVKDDPFDKVKKLIKDLIVRLMQEANEEASHKAWCDTELSTNEQTRTEKTAAVETLHAEIDEITASIAKLSEDLTGLHKAVADLATAMAEATKVRQEEKATNEETIKDSKEAQTAVAQALTVLQEFYATAGEATALVQRKGHQQKKQPAIFDSPYTGMQAESGGIIGMLQVVESDFGRLEAETTASEATSQKFYDEFMTDSKVDKAQKTKDIEHKEAKKQDQEQALVMKGQDLEGTQKELDAALAYFDKLKPSCVDAGTSYDDRVARRKEEIESLQEALRILNGEEIA